MKAKKKGARNEHRSMALLEAAGYRCVRSGGSLGEWDIIGLGLKDTVLVQVKSNRGPGRMERMALMDFPIAPFMRRLIHVWKDRQKLPVVEEL